MASGNSSENGTQYVELVDWISLRRNMRSTLPFYLGFRFCEDYNTTSFVVEPPPLGLQNRLRMEADWRKGNKQARRLSRVVGTVPCLAS